jgi:hypothetical protein
MSAGAALSVGCAGQLQIPFTAQAESAYLPDGSVRCAARTLAGKPCGRRASSELPGWGSVCGQHRAMVRDGQLS